MSNLAVPGPAPSRTAETRTSPTSDFRCSTYVAPTAAAAAAIVKVPDQIGAAAFGVEKRWQVILSIREWCSTRVVWYVDRLECARQILYRMFELQGRNVFPPQPVDATQIKLYSKEKYVITDILRFAGKRPDKMQGFKPFRTLNVRFFDGIIELMRRHNFVKSRHIDGHMNFDAYVIRLFDGLFIYTNLMWRYILNCFHSLGAPASRVPLYNLYMDNILMSSASSDDVSAIHFKRLSLVPSVYLRRHRRLASHRTNGWVWRPSVMFFLL